MSGHVDGGNGGLGAEPQVANLPLAGRKLVGAGDQTQAETTAIGILHLAAKVSSFRVDLGTNSVPAEQSSHLQIV